MYFTIYCVEMLGALTDTLSRRPADRRRPVRTNGRTRPTAGPNTTGCTTVTGSRLVRCNTRAAAEPLPTRTHCRRWPRPASSTANSTSTSCTTSRSTSCTAGHRWRPRRPGRRNRRSATSSRSRTTCRRRRRYRRRTRRRRRWRRRPPRPDNRRPPGCRPRPRDTTNIYTPRPCPCCCPRATWPSTLAAATARDSKTSVISVCW